MEIKVVLSIGKNCRMSDTETKSLVKLLISNIQSTKLDIEMLDTCKEGGVFYWGDNQISNLSYNDNEDGTAMIYDGYEYIGDVSLYYKENDDMPYVFINNKIVYLESLKDAKYKELNSNDYIVIKEDGSPLRFKIGGDIIIYANVTDAGLDTKRGDSIIPCTEAFKEIRKELLIQINKI